jgi:hypothetical protein
MLVRAVGFLVIFGFSASVSCRQLQIGSAKLDLPMPPSYCELDDGKAADKRELTAIRGMLESTTLLAMFADCNQLDQWRSGKLPLLKNMIQYQTVTEAIDQTAGPDDIEAGCAELRANGQKIIGDMMPDVRSRAEIFMKNVDHIGQQFLGVLDETPGSVCYSAVLNRFKAENGIYVVQMTLWAMTVVKQRPFYIYVFAPYMDATTMPTALANLKTYYTSFVDANK